MVGGESNEIGKVGTTNRGFSLGEFKDEYGYKCSIQKSSLATKSCIWLGVDDIKPQILIPGQGWSQYELPSNVYYHSRMHLTMEQVRDLIPILQKFADTGDLNG